MPVTGNPAAVRVGPGKLLIAPLETAEPADLATAWDSDWVEVGYTDEGSTFVFDQTFEDVNVAEEYDPVHVLQTARQITLNFAAAELTATNLQRAFNGGTITTASGLVTFEPPDAGDFTPVMIGWEADDNYERWVFRRCLQVGSVEIARRKAPDKATVPMSFRATKPSAEDATFIFIADDDYAPEPEGP
jgi:hypothetical protein